MQYDENSLSSKAISMLYAYPKIGEIKNSRRRRLETQPVPGSKNRLLAGCIFLTNPLRIIASIVTAITLGHVTGIAAAMPIAIVTTARKDVVAITGGPVATV